MRPYIIILNVAALIVCVGLAVLVTEQLNLNDLLPIISVLQNVSAAVFTLAGIWVAYSYPEAISTFTNPDKLNLIKGTEHTKRIRSLVLTIFSSAFVLVGIVCISLFYPYIRVIWGGQPYYLEIKMVGVSFINYLSFMQLQAISRIMINNLEFIYSLMKVKAEQEVHDDLSK